MQNMSQQLPLNIKKVREFKSFSPEQMADCLDISPRSYADLESGSTKISINRLEKISDVLETSIEELLYLHEKNANLYGSPRLSVHNSLDLIDREAYHNMRKDAEKWQELYLHEKLTRQQTEERWQERMIALMDKMVHQRPANS